MRLILGQKSHKNYEIHIDVSHSRQPLVKGERLVRYEVNTVMCVHALGELPHQERMPTIYTDKGLTPQAHSLWPCDACATCKYLCRTQKFLLSTC